MSQSSNHPRLHPYQARCLFLPKFYKSTFKKTNNDYKQCCLHARQVCSTRHDFCHVDPEASFLFEKCNPYLTPIPKPKHDCKLFLKLEGNNSCIAIM